jgi:hypothetical protein
MPLHRHTAKILIPADELDQRQRMNGDVPVLEH